MVGRDPGKKTEGGSIEFFVRGGMVRDTEISTGMAFVAEFNISAGT
jgi:hypothetical protein